MKIFHFVFIFLPVNGKLPVNEKVEFCANLKCDENDEQNVCGVRYKGEDVLFKLFDNVCELFKYGCRVEDNETYGLISMENCSGNSTTEKINHVQFVTNCANCSESGGPVCAIRPDGEGYKIRSFQNACQLHRYNCDHENELQFTATEFFICSNDSNLENEEENEMLDEKESIVTPQENELHNPIKTKNLIVVRSMIDPRNINESIRNFFAATHHVDLPIKDMQSKLNESTRRRLVEIFGPIKVFEPWTKIPKTIEEDSMHLPTLNSCYHKCPTECPETYAPVCGVPGTQAREPSLTFRNHCFMDLAQCKMRWEGNSETATSSAYIENPFLFCLGDELNSLYRFLPLIRTLQHMGRLKKKGTYKRKLRNMRFFNGHPRGDVNIMG